MKKYSITSPDLALKLGAYSHAMVVETNAERWVFTTGQIALSNTGEVLFPNQADKQATYIYETLNKILQLAECSLDDVVKTTVYLTDMRDFAKVSPIRNQFLKTSEPPSTLISVSELVKPGCVVEIEVVAVKSR